MPIKVGVFSRIPLPLGRDHSFDVTFIGCFEESPSIGIAFFISLRVIALDRIGRDGRGVPSGRATLALTVTPSGRLAACTPIQGSGSAELDAELCALLMSRSRWAPAIDRRGEPVTVQLRYTAVWNRD